MIHSELQEVDQLVRFGAEERCAQDQPRLLVDNCLQQTVSLPEHLCLRDGDRLQTLDIIGATRSSSLRLGHPYLCQRRGGEDACRQERAVTGRALAFAEELITHNAVVVQRDIGELWATCDIAHRPDMGSGTQVLIDLNKASRSQSDTSGFEVELFYIGTATDGDQDGFGSVVSLRRDDRDSILCWDKPLGLGLQDDLNTTVREHREHRLSDITIFAR